MNNGFKANKLKIMFFGGGGTNLMTFYCDNDNDITTLVLIM